MPKRLVRFALIQYVVDGRQEMAFRNQTVELSDAEAKRFDALGATLPVDAELDRPGTLASLGEAPSDEELIAWVISATPSEVAAVVATRPILAGRIEGALSQVEVQRDYQDKQLRMAAKVASGASAKNLEGYGESAMVGEGAEDASSHVVPAGSSDPADTPAAPIPPSGDGGTGDGGQATPPPGSVVIGDPNAGTPDTTRDVEGSTTGATPPNPSATETAALGGGVDPAFADTIVGGNVDDVTDYLADNPEHASAILEAENRRAAAANKEPRAGVVRAVEAAAGHTQ